MNKCNKCGKMIEMDHKMDSCPFCGSKIETVTITPTVEDALSSLVREYGKEVFLEDKKLIGLLSDIIPQLDKERKLLGIAVQAGTYKELYACPAGDEIRTFEKCVSVLTDSYFVDEMKARTALMWCADALSMQFPVQVKEDRLETESLKRERTKEQREDVDDIQEGKPNDVVSKKNIIKVYDDGALYTGEWENGKRNGHGTLQLKNGDVLTGEWKEDKYVSGNTSLSLTKGLRYQGEMDHWKPHGFGRLIYSNGAVFEGQWKRGKRVGYGRIHYSDGSIKESEWNDSFIDPNLAEALESIKRQISRR